MFDCEPRVTYKFPDGHVEQVCKGEYENWMQQRIINTMVVTVFGFGNYVERDPPETPFYGATLNQQYAIHMAFVYIAILLILVMLCTKPCIVKFAGSKQVHEEN